MAHDCLILNEAVNFEKESIFIAIPKAGTTSIRSQLAQQGTPLIQNPHLNIVQVRDSIYVYLLLQALGRNHDFPSRSIASDAHIRSEANMVFASFFKFAAVRNPWARAVSLYSRREGVVTKDKVTFDEFCRSHMYASDTCIHPTLHQNQLDWLCDDSGRCVMDYVYRVEDLDHALSEIAERTNGRLRLVSGNLNVNPGSGSSSYRDLYTDDTRLMIARRFEKDIDCFGYSF